MFPQNGNRVGLLFSILLMKYWSNGVLEYWSDGKPVN